MTENIVKSEELNENKCKCGCGKTIPAGKTFAQGHYSKHLKAIREQNTTPTQPHKDEPKQDENAPIIVTSFTAIRTDPTTDAIAWFETDQNEMIFKKPVGIGIISGMPYYLIATSEGSLIPPQLIPGFRGVFTSSQMDEIIAYQTEQQNIADQKALEDAKEVAPAPIQEVKAKPEEKPAEPIRVIIPPPAAQEEKANAQEQKKKSSSFLGTIFKKKEPKKNESQEISNMLKKIQEGASGG